MKTKIKFIIDSLNKAECPVDKKWLLIPDPKTQGLKLRLMKSGPKAFIFQRRLPANNENPGTLVEIVLGRFGDLSIEQARQKADELNRIIGQGKNPIVIELGELTYDRLFRTYIEQYAKHETSTWEEAVENHRRYFARWANKPITKIKRSDIQAWVYDLAGEGRKKKHTANRSFDQLKAVINFGKRKDLVYCDNPCIGVDKIPTKSRERFIQPGDEFARFAQALADEPNETWRDFFWLSLFVAARRSNVLAMAWDQINFELETWTIPKTKNGDSHSVPLTPSAMEILKRRYHDVKRNDIWVFYSDRRSRKTGEFSHMGNPKEAWKRLLKRAEITDLRIHDLRRTAGSYMAIQGVSPTIIGKALGHKSQAATAMYARLTQDPVRQAMINAQAALATPSKIFPSEGKIVVNIQSA